MKIAPCIALVAFSAVSATTALAASQKISTPAKPVGKRKVSTPNDMVGKWRWSEISPETYENAKTGELESEGNTSTSFTFTKDGHYTYKYYVKLRTSNTTYEASNSSEGTVTWGSNNFTMHPNKGQYKSWYQGRKTVDRNMTPAELKSNTRWYWQWRAVKENTGVTLVLAIGQNPNIRSERSEFRRDI